MSGGWFLYCVLAMLVAAIARSVETGRISSGVALFVFGFALLIAIDEVASKGKKPVC